MGAGAAAQTTPMMEQYRRVKADHPEAVLLFRVGDFYEMFFDDARLAAEKLELALTARGKEAGEEIPLAGVPHHAVETYIGRLVAQGYSVAVCDQVEDPKAAKGIVRREVTRVVTPGTVLIDGCLRASDHNWLAALSARGGATGLSWADVTTGDFFCAEFSGAAAEEELLSELSRLSPREILLPPGLSGDEGFLERARTWIGGPVSFRPCPAEPTAAAAARGLLDEFGLGSLEGLGLGGFGAGLVAASLVVDYVRSTQKCARTPFLALTPHRRGVAMALDPATRANLELTRTLRDGAERGSLFSALDRTRTAMGARALRAWLHEPLVERGAILARQALVAALFDDRALAGRLRALLGDVYDLERLLTRLAFGSATPRDLRMIATSLGRAVDVRDLCAPVPALAALAGAIGDPSATVERLERALVDSPPLSSREGGIFRDGVSGELDSLRTVRTHGGDWMLEFEEKERARTGIRSLKVKYNRVFGYYLEVTRANLELVPADYIRKQTIAGAERYYTPELKEMESRILGADDRMRALEHELFVALRDELVAGSDRLLASAKAVAEVDALLSLAEAAVENGYIRPAIVDGPALRIRGGRHPVVERMEGVRFVANDTSLEPGASIHLVTGPNMAGKSTYIRQVALITLLAQMGSYVPAEEAEIGVVDRIFTRVGASDNLYRGQSTFMVEMIETANILRHATTRSLVILDEIGRGTSTFDGLSIAWSVVEYLARGPARLSGVKTLFATHYHELTRLEGALPGVRNFNVAVVERDGTVVFRRVIVPGGADRSYGIHVAALAGIPAAVLERARRVLKELEAEARRKTARGQALLEDDGQGSLFAAEPEAPAPPALTGPAAEALAALAAADPDALSPREALDLLYRLRDLSRAAAGDGRDERP